MLIRRMALVAVLVSISFVLASKCRAQGYDDCICVLGSKYRIIVYKDDLPVFLDCISFGPFGQIEFCSDVAESVNGCGCNQYTVWWNKEKKRCNFKAILPCTDGNYMEFKGSVGKRCRLIRGKVRMPGDILTFRGSRVEACD